jgi:non-ribosomal peptide synthetase component E (peptide arylation enzyme)
MLVAAVRCGGRSGGVEVAHATQVSRPPTRVREPCRASRSLHRTWSHEIRSSRMRVVQLFIKGTADDLVHDLVAQETAPIEIAEDQPFNYDELEERLGRAARALHAAGLKAVTSFVIERQGVLETAVQNMHTIGIPPPGPSPVELPVDRHRQNIVKKTCSEVAVAAATRICGTIRADGL